jgi:hypothetical protein
MKVQLSAIVTPRFNDKRKQEGSHLYIVIKGPTKNIGVASCIAGGKWTEEQALREFNIARKRFTLIDEGMKLAQSMQLCQ